MQVRATQTGYYGGKVREPGEEFELKAAADFSDRWMAGDPLDHDGDGKKGGSKPSTEAKPLTEREIAKNEAIALGLEFPANIPTPKLIELIAAKKAELAAAGNGNGGLSDDDKILKALELSGRTDEMTVAEAETIIAAANAGGTDI